MSLRCYGKNVSYFPLCELRPFSASEVLLTVLSLCAQLLLQFFINTDKMYRQWIPCVHTSERILNQSLIVLVFLTWSGNLHFVFVESPDDFFRVF